MTQGEATQADPLIGATIVGKYKIIKLLGEGGMGCVYLGEQALGTTNRKVAVKTLHKHLSHDASIKARFQREVGTVAALQHPNTIQVFDFGSMEDGTLYIVMEYVQGRSVGDVLEKDGAMPPARVDNIMRQVAGSLEEAHGQGVVHRDLKPDNVLLCDRAGTKDWVEVLDFGIAKRSSEHDPNEAKLTQQGMVLGTPPYMSPEQFTGQPVDTRTDIYALGIMAYEMLTGKFPFEANTAWEWASKHMTEIPRPIEQQPLGAHVPEKMRAAIMRALAKNKEERFPTVKEFYEGFSMSGASHPSLSDAGPVSMAGGPPRAKTEMAQPMVGAPISEPNPGAMTPPYGAPPSPMMGGGPAIVPAAPMREAPSKGGGAGLVIGLAVLAVLLLGGGGVAYFVTSKPKPVAIMPIDTSTTPSAVTSVASAMPDDSSASAGDVAPLDGGVAHHVVNNGGGTTPPHTTVDAGHAGPVPTPKPPEPKPDPPVCARARTARDRRSPVAHELEAQCLAAGGRM